jgi:hypothetical protein
MTTRICSGARPNSQRASITSSALFIMVAESTEILRPMTQVGVGAGLLRGDSPKRSRVALAKRPARGGQDDAVHALRPGAAVFRQALEDGRVLAVDGQQRAAALAHGLHEQGTAHHQGLFVGQQQPFACPRSRQAGARPAAPTMAPMTVSTSACDAIISSSIWRLQYLRFKVVLL